MTFEGEMDKDESRKLLAKGRDAWNKWAEKQLANRDTSISRLDHMRADFSDCTFDPKVTFEGFVFPGDALFDRAIFQGRGDFRGVAFHRRASLMQSRFRRVADFRDARFEMDAQFDGAVFDRGPLTLRGATFSGAAVFRAAEGAVPLLLERTSFGSLPDFRLSQFRAPQFDEVSVGHGLVLRFIARDDIVDPRHPIFRWCRVADSPGNAARLRTLRSFAIAGHDHEREPEFHAQEIISRRFWQDKPLGRGAARFWLGMLYGFLSSFGRSFLRPTLILFAMWAGFAGYYWSQQSGWARGTIVTQESISPPKDDRALARRTLDFAQQVMGASEGCGANVEGPASSHAFFLSTKNALLGLGGAREEETRQAYKCLYGKKIKAEHSRSEAKNQDDEPIIPAQVTYASYAQNIFSLICFWFMGLAARNMFRQK
jgi:pentapeptide repeat protein